jgi:hypothetical protein
MKALITLCIFIVLHTSLHAQKPDNGTYTYKLCYVGHANSFNTCTVVIKEDSITVFADYYLSVPKGEIIEQGIILHHKSGKWIIGQKPADKDADKIGGCRGGPMIIDFKTKRVWSC